MTREIREIKINISEIYLIKFYFYNYYFLYITNWHSNFNQINIIYYVYILMLFIYLIKIYFH